jgi:hypothetical protein
MKKRTTKTQRIQRTEKILCVLCVFVVLFFAVPTLGAEEAVSARIVRDKEKIFIGDPVRIEIGIQHRAGNNYELKLDPSGLGFFELRGRPVVQTRAIDGQSAETRIEFTLAPFRTGKLPIPPLIIERNPGEVQLQTAALEINVEPLTSLQERQIKDVRPLPTMPLNGWLQTAVITIMLASAGLYLLLRFADARIAAWMPALFALFVAGSAAETEKPAVSLKTLEDEAIARLRLLLASGLASTDVKRFHIQLADIMTVYAITRYGRPDYEYTTGELFELFEAKGVPVLVSSAFEQILGACDTVKFARGRPETESAERSARQAIDLLNALNFNNSPQRHKEHKEF